jgi:hypothetical protein
MSLLEDSALQQIQSVSQTHKFSAVQIRSNKIIVTNESIDRFRKREMNERSLSNLELKGTVTGIKPGVVAKINKMLTNWIKSLTYENEIRRSAQLRVERVPIFLTLTLPAIQVHSDIRIKREVLMPFIQSLKRNFEVEYYFWKAELQKNYNIHFHLVIDKYIDKYEVQKLWNTHCNVLHYVDRFFEIHHHNNPPSTHIQLIKDLECMTAYLTKYVCKNEIGGWVDGMVWNCSKALKKMKNVVFELDNDMAHVIDQLLLRKKLTLYEEEHFAILTFTKEFDHKKDYDYFRGLERFEYIALYSTLYDNKQEAPVKDISDTAKKAKCPVQLKLDLDIVEPYRLWD